MPDKVILARNQEHYGLIDWSEKVVVPFIYDELCRYTENFMTTLNKKHGVLDLNGKELLRPEYDFINEGPHFFITHKNGKLAIVNHQGVRLPVPEFDSYDFCCRQLYFKIMKGDKVGLLDEKGNVVYPCIYKNIDCHST
ncbi:MAG: repeat-containing protein [Mucilaginibacter sp.]|nr:repeat-containing protein [Mucilaginibacter sp.]